MREVTKGLSIEQTLLLHDSDGNISFEKVFVAITKGAIASKYYMNSHGSLQQIEDYMVNELKAFKFINRTRAHRANPPGATIENSPKLFSVTPTYLFQDTVNEDNCIIASINYEGGEKGTRIDVYYNVAYPEAVEKMAEWNTNIRKAEKAGGVVGFISQQGSYWDMEEVEIEHTPEIDFDLNYNSDFDYKRVQDLVNGNDKAGLILLGGAPGSGKTNYLRWLMANSKKKFVYMPSNQIGLMSSPAFITYALSELKDCVLLLEDCEEALIARNEMKGGEVQTILNLSDGIIGAALNLTIIGTYNTKDNIDKALFRKGRLLYMYDFGGLAPDKATALSTHLGHNVTYTTKTVLSEVYNPEANMIEHVKPVFGFITNK